LFQRDNPITGVATGFYEIDMMTSGLQPSDLVIVAGRPSMGKTAFAVNIAQHAAIKESLPVAIFSMEMPSEQLAMRMLSSLGRIDQHKIRTGKLGDDDWPRLTHAVGILSEANLYIDDTPALSPGEIRARCRRLAREHGLGLIVVDYLQLMQVHGSKENRATEISEISRSLKALAKELNVPVLALSQLNRSLESRNDKRPVMSDLRESGAIEQDADVIMFIYRDEVYDEDSVDKGIAEIIIGKQRNGPIGIRKLRFFGEYTTFENLAYEDYPSVEGPG
jgi:replicative DNA helicase